MMKYFLIIIILIINFKAISQNVTTDYWDNGKKVREGLLIDTIRDGKWTWWYKSGNLWKEGNYNKGVKIGKWITFYDDGNIQSQEFMENGTNIFWIPNKIKKSEVNVVNGKYDGKFISWYDNGNIDEEIEYRNGVKEGKTTKYHKNGNKNFEGFYVNDKLNCYGIWWYENGTKEMEGKLLNDEQDSIWTFYHTNGKIGSKGNFIKGKQDGKWLYYYETGEKWKEGSFNKGKKTGKWITYFESGWTQKIEGEQFKYPDLNTVVDSLNLNFNRLKNQQTKIDSITFAGNGEPTLYPNFEIVVDEIFKLRNQFLPNAKISLLSNGGTLDKQRIRSSLKKIDNRIFKLDAGSNEMFHIINGTSENIKIENIVYNLKNLDETVIIQSLFLRGLYKNVLFDNTSAKEVEKWLNYISEIIPEYVMIYPINRQTPLSNIEKISREDLCFIAKKVENLGIKAKVYD